MNKYNVELFYLKEKYICDSNEIDKVPDMSKYKKESTLYEVVAENWNSALLKINKKFSRLGYIHLIEVSSYK